MIKNISIKNSHQIIVILSITFTISIIIWNMGDEKVALPTSKLTNIDTHIPYGFTLRPIEIANFDSLNALVGDFAIVNLYQVFENKKTALVLQRVKLIRSPKDPRYFGVLIRSEDSKALSNYSGPFQVSLHNPKKPNQLIFEKTPKLKRKITVEGP